MRERERERERGEIERERKRKRTYKEVKEMYVLICIGCFIEMLKVNLFI